MRGWRRIWGLTYGEAAWLAAAVCLLAYELWVVLLRPEGYDVLTRAYRANAPRWSVLPVALGVLMGHLHGPVLEAPRWAPAIFVVLVAGALARDLWAQDSLPPVGMMGLFLVSFMVGASCWVGRP